VEAREADFCHGMVWIGGSFLAAQAKQKNLSPLPNSKP